MADHFAFQGQFLPGDFHRFPATGAIASFELTGDAKPLVVHQSNAGFPLWWARAGRVESRAGRRSLKHHADGEYNHRNEILIKKIPTPGPPAPAVMSGVSLSLISVRHTRTWKQGRWLQLKALAVTKNCGQPEALVFHTNFAFAEAKWQLDGRSAAGVTACCCACGRLARLMPAGERTKRCGGCISFS